MAAAIGAAVPAATPAGAIAQGSGESSEGTAIRASFSPERPGARGALTLDLRIGGSEEDELPPPLRTLTVHLPSGLAFDLGGASTCAAKSLRHGPGGCPARSLVGRGSAVMEVHAGSQSIPEDAQVWAFRAPDRGGHLAFTILTRGFTPLDEQTIWSATLLADRAPYGSRLVISIPPIPTVMYEPDASVISLSLTVGAGAHGRHPTAAAVTVPRHCPPGGLPFAADFGFEGGLSAAATVENTCP